jgi:hypothetical protein
VLTPCTPPQGPLEPVQGDQQLGSPLHHPFLREPDPLRRRSSSSFALRRIFGLHSPSVSLTSSPWFCCAGCRSPWQPAAPRTRARRRVRRPEPPFRSHGRLGCFCSPSTCSPSRGDASWPVVVKFGPPERWERRAPVSPEPRCRGFCRRRRSAAHSFPLLP